jgi:hypothetical protein
MYMQRTTSGAAGNGVYTTAKYMRDAAGIGLGTTIKHLRRATSGAAGKRHKRSDEVTAAHNERRREQWLEHHDHPLVVQRILK